jgi:hypothetical protein
VAINIRAKAEVEYQQDKATRPSTREVELEAKGLTQFNGQTLQFNINGTPVGTGVVRRGELKIRRRGATVPAAAAGFTATVTTVGGGTIILSGTLFND